MSFHLPEADGAKLSSGIARSISYRWAEFLREKQARLNFDLLCPDPDGIAREVAVLQGRREKPRSEDRPRNSEKAYARAAGHNDLH
jgi:hypothetical protein